MLTRRTAKNRLPLMDGALKIVLAQLIGGRSILEASRLSGVKHQLIYAILEGRSQKPGREVLEGLAKGLTSAGCDYTRTYRRLALAAYGIITDDEYDPETSDDTRLEMGAPPESNGAWQNPTPPGRSKAIAST
jgi:hypothetical protein